MKKIIIAVALMVATGLPSYAAQKHRHHRRHANNAVHHHVRGQWFPKGLRGSLGGAGVAEYHRHAKYLPRATRVTVGTVLRGRASYYGQGFDGRKTACGTIFNRNGLTAASKTLPCGSIVRVTNRDNGKSMNVTILDRGPYVGGRMLDVAEIVATKLGFHAAGIGNVSVEILSPGWS